jgi:hypothetical protein
MDGSSGATRYHNQSKIVKIILARALIMVDSQARALKHAQTARISLV